MCVCVCCVCVVCVLCVYVFTFCFKCRDIEEGGLQRNIVTLNSNMW